MPREDFLRRVENIRVWRRRGQRAPHKPLLLLLALGRVQRGKRRLVHYEEVDKLLGKLWRHFGRPDGTLHSEYPFNFLREDGLWEVRASADPEQLKGRGGWIHHAQLVRHDASGGFPSADQQLLRTDPGLVDEAARRLLNDHFPPSWHDAIRDAVGLTRSAGSQASARMSSTRDPAFRHAVLRAYERRCAVCGFDVRLDRDFVGLDAAHIRWPSHGGPDEVPNGLALCVLHERMFGWGAIGLEPDSGHFRVVVSDELNGQGPGFRQLVDCHGRPLREPQRDAQRPAPRFVEWHRGEVFRGTPREHREV